MKPERERPDRRTVLYRLVVGGRVGSSWVAWFGADTVTPVGPDTRLDVRVADQSELFGRLRRIHDLNLRLISVTRVDPDHPGSDSSHDLDTLET